MPEERAKAMAWVDEQVASGQIATFDDWEKVIFHPDKPGVVEDEGGEFEGDLEAGEPVWLDEAAASLVAADDKDLDLDEP